MLYLISFAKAMVYKADHIIACILD